VNVRGAAGKKSGACCLSGSPSGTLFGCTKRDALNRTVIVGILRPIMKGCS
jgi:hypothetical protein